MTDPGYEVGDQPRLWAMPRETSTGSGYVPSMIALHVREPAGTVATYAIGGASPPAYNSASGYYLDLLLSSPGLWHYRWRATGPGPHTTENGILSVASSPLGN